MSKERLKEIEECIKHDLIHNDGMMLSVHYEDIRWLIEQTKQKESYKDNVVEQNYEILRLLNQNKCYREAMEKVLISLSTVYSHELKVEMVNTLLEVLESEEE